MANKPWTRRQEEKLRKEYPTCPDTRKLAKKFGRSYKAMATRAKLLNLKRTARNSNHGRSKATKADDRFMRKNYLRLACNAVAKKLGHSETLIKGRYKYLGLVVPEDIRKKFAAMSRFKKGMTPVNKGKKISEFMSKGGIARSAKTRFKTGQESKRWVGFKDGDISFREDHRKRNGKVYVYIRLSTGKWYPFHQYIWEYKNGRLPAGKCLWFRDGETMNCTLKNLELITRAEGMTRNSCSVRLTDNYVAMTLARQKGGIGLMDKELAKEYLQDKELIDTARQNYLLKRTIKGKLNAKN